MQITLHREPRSAKEGIALNVITRRDDDDIYQFKIDVWSEKGSGLYRLRLDGFNYLRNIEATSLQEIFLMLARLDPKAVEKESASFHEKIREVIRNAPSDFDRSSFILPDISELAVGDYFAVAKGAMLRELAPMIQGGQN
jgi:hypothetical protein